MNSLNTPTGVLSSQVVGSSDEDSSSFVSGEAQPVRGDAGRNTPKDAAGVPEGEWGGLTPKQAWWAGYRVGKQLPPDMPRTEAVKAAPGWLSDFMHASAPTGCGCADCAIDKEPCPTCYAAAWQSRHPNVNPIDSAKE